MSKKTIPAVSIIIPMYNTEKYVGECLDSIFAQTFDDYEVIVVDDCSTDNSCAIVESYLPKFNRGGVERFKLIRRKINSGNPGMPINKGLAMSRGEYMFFMDSDDFITKTALEELYCIAKKFDADVVHCERYFQFRDGEKNFTLEGYQTGELVKEPTLITENLVERAKDLYAWRFIVNLWTKLIRRDFILENNLSMISGLYQDVVFTYCLVYSAKIYVRVPNVVNFYRVLENSHSHKKHGVPGTLQKWINALIKGFRYLDNFLSEREFFKKRSDVKQLALEVWVRECCRHLQEIYAQVPTFQFDELLRKEFEGNALMAFLFSRMNVFNVNMNRQGATIQQMNAYIQRQNQVIQQLQAQIKQLKGQ